MICYYGRRGRGKTRASVVHIYKEFQKDPNLIVFTNIPLNFPPHKKTGQNLKSFFWSDLSELKTFFEFAKMNHEEVLTYNTILFIDEANLLMPSRFFNSIPRFILSFLAQSRHLNVEVIYTTQAISRVDKVLRELTEIFYHCKSFGGLLTLMKECDLSLDGDSIEELGKKSIFFPSRVHDFYDTHFLVAMTGELDPEFVRDERTWNFIQESYFSESSKEVSEALASGASDDSGENQDTPK